VSYLSRKRRRDLARQKWQFLAAGLTVTVGVLMFAASYDSYRNLKASYAQTYDRLAFADMTVTGGAADLSTTLEAIDGVAAVTVRHSADVPVTIGDATIRGRLIGMPVDGQPTVDRIDIQTGSGLSSPTDAVAEVHVARTFALGPGDTIEVHGPDQSTFDVVGVAASAEYIWPAAGTQDIFPDAHQFGVFFVDDAAVAALGDPLVVTETLVAYDEGADRTAVDASVTSAAVAAGATNILTAAEQPSNSTLQLDVEGFGAMAIAFPVLFLTAAGMAVYVMMTRIVFAQRSIIGTLRASGMPARRLRSHYLGFGLWIGTVGSLVGIALGVATGAAMTSIYTGELDIPDTVIALHPLTIVVGIAFGVLTGAVAALVPARSAYRIEPAEAMRGVAPTIRGGRSSIERLMPWLARSSVRTRMTVRGIGRAKRRSLSTVIGVVLALVLVLASGGMIDTVVTLIHQQFDEIDLQDASIILAQPLTAPMITSIAAVPGVADAEPVVMMPATIRIDGRTVATTIQGFEADTRMHGWTNDAGVLPADGLVAGRAIADRLDVGIGDVVTVDLPSLDTSVRMTLADFVDEPLGMPLYLRTDALVRALTASGVPDPRAALDVPSITTAMTVFDEGVDRSTVIAAIGDLDGVVAVHDARALYAQVQQYLGLFYVFVGIMLVFGAVMAFALMFATISVNVAERSGEFADLRANGMSERSIGWMIAGENLLLTAIGIIPGVILGVLAARWFMTLFDNDSFSFTATVQPLTIAVAVVGMVVVALLSMIPGIRTVRKLDIGAVVRERAV
jgi:putative ABC transport system permease protein